MYLLIVFLPLISALTAGLFGRFIGREGAKWITVGCTVTTFFMSLVAFYEVALAGSPCYFEVMTWIDSEMFSTSWGFMFDSHHFNFRQVQNSKRVKNDFSIFNFWNFWKSHKSR